MNTLMPSRIHMAETERNFLSRDTLKAEYLLISQPKEMDVPQSHVYMYSKNSCCYYQIKYIEMVFITVVLFTPSAFNFYVLLKKNFTYFTMFSS